MPTLTGGREHRTLEQDTTCPGKNKKERET